MGLKAGDRVHYVDGFSFVKTNGIVKSVRNDIAFVVYRCDLNWNSYQNYTGQSTSVEDVHPGWVRDAENADHCKGYWGIPEFSCPDCGPDHKLVFLSEMNTDWYGRLLYYRCGSCETEWVSRDGEEPEIAASNR